VKILSKIPNTRELKKEVGKRHGKKFTGNFVYPQNDEIRQMGGPNSIGFYPNLAPFNWIILDSL
jgi:hypothetical protein